MRKIGIIGLGHVGRMLANQFVMTGQADELILIDQSDKLAIALQADLADAQTALPTRTRLRIQDYTALTDAEIVITAFGASRLCQQQPMAELTTSYQQALAVGHQLCQSDFSGILVNITNPNEVITAVLQQESQLPKKQVLGLGTILETGRMRCAVAEDAQVALTNVTGFVYGQHGGDQVYAWSTVRVNGQSIDQSINGHQLNPSQLKIKASLSNWYTLDGLGYNVSAVTAWTIRLVHAIEADEHLALPVAVYQPQYDTYLGFPALVGRHGVGNFLLLDLYSVEKSAIKTAAQTIKQQYQSLQNIGGRSKQ